MDWIWTASLLAQAMAVYSLSKLRSFWWLIWLSVDMGLCVFVWSVVQIILTTGFQHHKAWPTIYSILFMASQFPTTVLMAVAGVDQLPHRPWLRPKTFAFLVIFAALTSAAAILPEAYLPLIRSSLVAKITVRISILVSFVAVGIEWTWTRVWWAIYLTGCAAVEIVYVQSEGKLHLSNLILAFSGLCYLAIFLSRQFDPDQPGDLSSGPAIHNPFR